MDIEKRKRLDEGKVDGKKVKSESSKTEMDQDGEVEEFFQILRRIHVAVKYFQKGQGRTRQTTAAKPWNPNFEPEDFQGMMTIKAEKGLETTVEDNTGLDLNAEPDTQ